MKNALKPKTRTPIKAILLAGISMLGACATNPVQYNTENLDALSSTMLVAPELPSGFADKPLSLEDARQMAMTRNKAYQLKVDQLLFDINQKGASAKSMMPQIYANSFGRWRNNTNASVGVKVDDVSGAMPEDFYTAQDRSYANSNLTLSWNILDVGLMGYKKGMSEIDGFDAVETSRLGCHQLMVDVERAYWRKAAYTRAIAKREWLNERIDYALELSAEHMKNNPNDRLSELMYQRELIDIKRWYESMYRTLASANSDLAKLINVPHGTEFAVDHDVPRNRGEFGSTSGDSLEDLFATALKNRPELRKALYARDKTELQSKEAVLRHLPALGLFISGNQDTNSFALNEDFMSAGLNLSWDVLNLTNIGKTKDKGAARETLSEANIQVVGATIIAQTALSLEEVKNLEHEMDLAWKAKDVQTQITDRLAKDLASGDSRETYLVKEELLRELSILREDISKAELSAADARFQQSLGNMKSCQAG